MRIAVDFDGTIAHTNLLKREYGYSCYGIYLPLYMYDRTAFSARFSEAMYDKITAHIYKDPVTYATPALPGAIQGIKALAQHHELILITAAPPHRLAPKEKWLDARGILSCFTATFASGEGSKGNLCKSEGCDALIEDDVRHLNGTRSVQYKILLKYGLKKSINFGDDIHLAHSWKDIVRLIHTIDLALGHSGK